MGRRCEYRIYRTHNYNQSLTYREQEAISNDSLHHETAEALKLHSPYTPMNPTWLFEGTFEDWLLNTFPDLELLKKVRPSQHCPMIPHFDTMS
jgi:hypothetical protein